MFDKTKYSSNTVNSLNKKRYQFLKEKVFSSEISKKIKLDAAILYDLKRQKNYSDLISKNAINPSRFNLKTEPKSFFSPPKTHLQAFDSSESLDNSSTYIPIIVSKDLKPNSIQINAREERNRPPILNYSDQEIIIPELQDNSPDQT